LVFRRWNFLIVVLDSFLRFKVVQSEGVEGMGPPHRTLFLNRRITRMVLHLNRIKR
jgi:hypothetical protein